MTWCVPVEVADELVAQEGLAAARQADQDDDQLLPVRSPLTLAAHSVEGAARPADEPSALLRGSTVLTGRKQAAGCSSLLQRYATDESSLSART